MRLNLPILGSREIGRPKYRRSNPIIEGKLYQFRQPFFDYYGVTVATALTRQVLFTIPIGQAFTPSGGAAFVKSAWHTNMVQSGVLPSPQKFFAKSISLQVRQDIFLDDARRFLWDTLLNFVISQRSYGTFQVFKSPGGGGVFGSSSGIVGNGYPTRDNQFAFVGELGETIEQQQNFNVTLDPTQVIDAASAGVFTTIATAAGGQGVNVLVHIDGLLNREVL